MTIDFRAKQKEFSAYIRDPENNPAPEDVKIERMTIYKTLFFNNIENMLSANFPVLRTMLGDTMWRETVRDFYAVHRSKTPYFSEIAEEFLDYLENERHNPSDFPFILELAHYEWVEMALANAKEQVDFNEREICDDLMQKSVSLSPLAWPLIYRYPVHRLSPTFLPLTPPAQPVCLIAYRNQDDVNFMEITPATFHMLQFLEDNGGLSVESYLNQFMHVLHPSDPENISRQGLKILIELAERNILTVMD